MFSTGGLCFVLKKILIGESDARYDKSIIGDQLVDILRIVVLCSIVLCDVVYSVRKFIRKIDSDNILRFKKIPYFDRVLF